MVIWSKIIYNLLGKMPPVKGLMLPLRTIALRCVARDLKIFWNEEWDPELQEVTEVSDHILLDLRKDFMYQNNVSLCV